MKRAKKILLWFLILIFIAAASVFAWVWFTDSDKRDPFTVIPDDAIFVIETNEMTKGWNTLNQSRIWNHLLYNEYFEDINKSALTLDSIINGNKVLDMLMSDRKLLVSAHLIEKNDYDFLFVVDLKQASKISFIKDYIKEITGLFGYAFAKKDFQKNDVIVLTDNKTKEELYISFVDNILMCSYSEHILQNSILCSINNYWHDNKSFLLVKNEMNSRQLFNFYFNYDKLNDYINCFVQKEDEMLKVLGNTLAYSALNFYFEEERLSLIGYTNLKDTVQSYLHALLNVEPGTIRAYEILSSQTALYLSMSFDDFLDFRDNLECEFAAEDTVNHINYAKNVAKIERLLKINVEEDFFNWIGSEIVFSKMRPAANSREEDMVVAIHARDTLLAKKGLNNIITQIKRRTPVKFEAVDYKNFLINQLVVKGFFKMFLGNLFNKLETPYFTFIEDYVVFSNSHSALIDVIDHYIKGETLSNNDNFMKFLSDFDEKANITAFIQMPKLYSHLYYYSNKEKRKGITKNKEIILSFVNIGLQLQGDGRSFKTTLIAQHDPDAMFNDELEKFESAAEELFTNEFDSLLFKPDLNTELLKDGPYKIKYEDSSTIKYEGRIKDGLFDGLWRSYYENGKIKSAVNYKEGIAEGVAIFYYDNPSSTIKTEIKFVDDKIEGVYREFYENGARKATLNFKKGVADGDAEFFYKTGVIKIKGSYKNGEKSGKWRYYTEKGELFDKERLRKRQNK